MSNKRPPFWLTAADFYDLDRLIMRQIEAGEREHSAAIHEELSVAKTRYANSRFRSGLLPTVLGLEKGSIPIRLSKDEYAYLLTLPLSETLRQGLTNA